MQSWLALTLHPSSLFSFRSCAITRCSESQESTIGRTHLKLTACPEHKSWKTHFLGSFASKKNGLTLTPREKKGQMCFIPSFPYSTRIPGGINWSGAARPCSSGRLGQPAMLCACLLYVVVPSSSGWDLENPLLMVKLIGHGAFQTFSVCLFSTRKVHNAACCCYKEPSLSLICTLYLSIGPRHGWNRHKKSFQYK